MTNNDCTFCDRAQFEERIVAETNEYYVVASLGQITDGGYVLIIPKKHISCVGALSYSQMSSLTKIFSRTRYAIAAEYHGENEAFAPVTAFEHGIVGQTIDHAHLHLVPARLDLASQVRKDFPTSEMVGVEFSVNLQMRYRERGGQKYLLLVFSEQALICWNPPAPEQYFRRVTAELLGRPERADWRQMDRKLDDRLCAETVARLKPYFT